MITKTTNGFMPKSFTGLLEDIFQNGLGAINNEAPTGSKSPVPVNIVEKDDAYTLQVVAPGLNKDEFKVGVDQNLLTISYEHVEEPSQEGIRNLRSEYHRFSFKRSFTLNEKIDMANINAKYNDGILHVTLPKKEVVSIAPQDIKVS